MGQSNAFAPRASFVEALRVILEAVTTHYDQFTASFETTPARTSDDWREISIRVLVVCSEAYGGMQRALQSGGLSFILNGPCAPLMPGVRPLQCTAYFANVAEVERSRSVVA